MTVSWDLPGVPVTGVIFPAFARSVGAKQVSIASTEAGETVTYLSVLKRWVVYSPNTCFALPSLDEELEQLKFVQPKAASLVEFRQAGL